MLGVLVADVAQLGEVHAAVFVIVPHQTARAVPHGHRAFGSREEVQNRKAQFRIRRLRADRPDAVAAQRGQTVDDGVRFVRHTRIHHLAFAQMLVRVVDHGGGIVEDAPEHAAVLHLLAHFVVGLRHGVRVKQTGAIELVEEAQHLDVRAVFVQRIVEFAIRGVVQTEAEFVIAIVRRRHRLDVHDHVAVPVRPEGRRIRLVAQLVRGADFLHLLEDRNQIVQILDFRVAELRIQIPAQIPRVHERLVALTRGRHVHAEAVQIVAVFGHQTVGRQRILIVRPNVGRIRLRKVVLVPLQQQTVLDRLLIVLAIRAPDDDVAEVAGLRAGLVCTILIGDDDQFNVEQILHQRSAPAGLTAGVVRQLAVNFNLDGRAVHVDEIVQVAGHLVVRDARGICGFLCQRRQSAQKHGQRQHQGEESGQFAHLQDSPFRI